MRGRIAVISHSAALGGAVLLAAACAPPRDDHQTEAAPATANPEPAAVATPPPAAPPPLAAQALVLGEWTKADNRAACAPASFAATGAEGTPRRAHFSGGWAVAWDQPGLRSAFGIAGTGFTPEDAADADAQRARLAAQWPLLRELPALPQPAFAGYGIEGARAYPEDDPQARGSNSLAYVRVAGQACDYNVWSWLGRAHLESLLDSLRLIER